MPTYAEFLELYKKVTSVGVTNYNGISGLNGRLFTSKIPGFEGNFIFIPSAGYYKRYEVGSYGYIWSSSLVPTDPAIAYYLDLSYWSIYPNAKNRCRGYSVRPVYKSRH